MPNDLRWRPDKFGTPARALYFRGLYAGDVRHAVMNFADGKSWRAWAQTSPEGEEVGWYHTEAEAKAALLTEATRAVGEQDEGG